MTVNTAITHSCRIYNKLDVHNCAELMNKLLGLKPDPSSRSAPSSCAIGFFRHNDNQGTRHALIELE
jgi:hypothetical protein